MLLQDGVHAPSSAKSEIMLLPLFYSLTGASCKKCQHILRKTHSLGKLTLGIVIL